MTGSGKTTLAQEISKELDIPIYYLDLIFWNEEGYLKDREFTIEQEKIMAHDKWIIDGSFPRSKSLDLRIQNADTIIFYDLPLLVILWRQLKRYIKYRNKVRPDFGKKQPYPFTIKDLKYAMDYPKDMIYEKLEALGKGKDIYVIRNNIDQNNFLNKIKK